MTKRCEVCGKSGIPIGCNKCADCNAKAVRELLKSDPQLKRAFIDTIEEMREPENIREIADKVVSAVQMLYSMAKEVQENA